MNNLLRGDVRFLTIIALLTAFGGLAPISFPATAEPSGLQASNSTTNSALPLQNVASHTYPRTGVFQWGGAVPEWYARFDLVMTRITDPDFIAQVRSLNPSVLWLPMRDFNKAYEGMSGFPEEWYLRDSQGDKIPLYSPDSFFVDLSDLGVRASGAIGGLQAANERLSEFYSRYLTNLVESSGSDGIATDGLYYRLHLQWRMWQDVDLDRNGVNDLDEHGKQWVIDHWANGIDLFLQDLRSRLGADKVILINTGSSDAPQPSQINGIIGEHTGGVYNWDYDRSLFADLTQKVHQPPVFLMNMNPDGSDPQRPQPSKDYFSFMRFGLARSMLLGEYFEFEDLEAGEHYFNKYYDEFDLDLGLPTGDMAQVKSGVWARFFDRGAVLANLNGHDVTVTEAELRSLSGYAGPYYRFRGGQDPIANDGTPFDQVELHGHSFSSGGLDPIAGDGLLLVKSPQTVVADIIIDNTGAGTSPGSPPPTFHGEWNQTCDANQAYTLRCAPWVDSSFDIAYASAGSNSVTFTPDIGVPGAYEVFEWHGVVDAGMSAHQVDFTIRHAGGTTTMAVDQTANPGAWNSLGTFIFAQGSDGHVVISAQDADGFVIADAIKFVYQGETSRPTFLDVPADHWAYEYIEALYKAGFTKGCSTDLMMYCPEKNLDRAEGAVFFERGIHDAAYLPPQPTEQVFDDVPLAEWYAKWVTGLWKDGLTAGCGTAPLVYCPLQNHSRAEASVYALRIFHGVEYVPPAPSGIFSDVSTDVWYAKWVEAAYQTRLIPPCDRSPGFNFCPDELVTRADMAMFLSLALGLDVPPPAFPEPPGAECHNWEAEHPEWIFCDDFEADAPMVSQGRYFEFDDDGGDFSRMEAVGFNGTYGMRVLWQQGEVGAGSLKVAFGRNPNGYMNKTRIRPNEDFREIYYRMYLKMQDGWQGDPGKLSRATIFPSANDWSQAMIAHLWGGRGNALALDPVRCVDESSKVKCIGYNDFAHMDWIGLTHGSFPIFDTANAGKWFCVEAHVRLNDPGQSNGLQEFWVDGELDARVDGLNFVRNFTDYGINAIFFENYWNSGSVQSQERYFDNIVISTEPIGCLPK
jgi:hypothetical protein